MASTVCRLMTALTCVGTQAPGTALIITIFLWCISLNCKSSFVWFLQHSSILWVCRYVFPPFECSWVPRICFCNWLISCQAGHNVRVYERGPSPFPRTLWLAQPWVRWQAVGCLCVLHTTVNVKWFLQAAITCEIGALQCPSVGSHISRLNWGYSVEKLQRKHS